jgi:hypothetical protein
VRGSIAKGFLRRSSKADKTGFPHTGLLNNSNISRWFGGIKGRLTAPVRSLAASMVANDHLNHKNIRGTINVVA